MQDVTAAGTVLPDTCWDTSTNNSLSWAAAPVSPSAAQVRSCHGQHTVY